ncbi:MAG TPA: flagellar protein FliS [Candidatus Acidoferrum sp.]|jgi:flagellar protein FliS
MNTQDQVFTYHQLAAVGVSSVDQVVALYDRILRDFHSSIAAISAGRIEERVDASNHALTVIGELQGVLDFDRGGDAAVNLNNFYNVARSLVTKASMTSSVEKFQELVAMFSRIRVAWAQVARTAPQVPSARRPRITSPQSAPQGTPNPEGQPELSSTGSWNA